MTSMAVVLHWAGGSGVSLYILTIFFVRACGVSAASGVVFSGSWLKFPACKRLHDVLAALDGASCYAQDAVKCVGFQPKHGVMMRQHLVLCWFLFASTLAWLSVSRVYEYPVISSCAYRILAQ